MPKRIRNAETYKKTIRSYTVKALKEECSRMIVYHNAGTLRHPWKLSALLGELKHRSENRVSNLNRTDEVKSFVREEIREMRLSVRR